MATVFNVPEAYLFPWGFLVRVECVNTDDPKLDGAHATWDVETHTIYLDRTKPIAELRGSFIHEFDHAYTDWKLWAKQNMNIKDPEQYNEPEEEDSTPPDS